MAVVFLEVFRAEFVGSNHRMQQEIKPPFFAEKIYVNFR